VSDSYDKQTLRRLVDGQLEWSALKRIMSRFKDAGRFLAYREILQERVEWPERILLPIAEKLFIVENADGSRSVKCECGHEVCEARENWRLHVLVYVRDTREKLQEIYRGAKAPDPRYMEIREFYCPGCAAQLEVDAFTPGYPIIQDFEPDIDTFYRDWLGEPLAAPPTERGG
jgi:acetone carboxylase, gamma subunit